MTFTGCTAQQVTQQVCGRHLPPLSCQTMGFGLQAVEGGMSHLQKTKEMVDHLELRVTAVRSALPFSCPVCGWEAVTHGKGKRLQYTTFSRK